MCTDQGDLRCESCGSGCGLSARTTIAVCYVSCSLTDCERRYSQTEKEALALVWAFEKFQAYVYGMKFDLVTDHKPLEAIYGPRSKPRARIERWVLRMQPYDFHVVHIPGSQNIADPLSRLIDGKAGPPEHKHEAKMYVRFCGTQCDAESNEHSGGGRSISRWWWTMDSRDVAEPIRAVK